MKRYLILAAAVALALSACKQEAAVEAPKPKVKPRSSTDVPPTA